jgi:hypothetical protein
MKTGKTLIAIAAAALIPLGAAVAGDKEKSGSMGTSFDTLDANRDGRISQVEASADTTIVFTSADKNGDGYLDKTEWHGKDKTGTTPAPQPQPQSMPESTDTVPQSPPESEPTPDTETPRQ